MNPKRLGNYGAVLCLIAIIGLSGCEQPNDPPPSGSTRISVTLQSDSTETVDATHPIRWEISATYNFSEVAETGTVSTGNLTTIDVDLHAGSYFVRAFIDKDNDGTLSYGDTFSIYSLMGSTQLIYTPKKVILAEGETRSVTLRPGVNEQTENNSDIPENFGTIYFFLNYTGSGTVDSTHWLYMGIGQDATLATTFMGYSVQYSGEKVYAIVPAGIWYAGGFFDIDGNAVTPNGMPSSGDPTGLYDNITYGGTNTGTPINVAAGTQTAMVDFEIDGSLVY